MPKPKPVEKEVTSQKTDKPPKKENTVDANKATSKGNQPAKADKAQIPLDDEVNAKPNSAGKDAANPKDSTSAKPDDGKIHWKKLPEHYPLPTKSIRHLPTGKPAKLPKIQHDFGSETEGSKQRRLQRLDQIKAEIKHAWTAYHEYAWGHDELRPVSGKTRDPFASWAATMVDSLDTLWIAGMRPEFEDAVKYIATIDFTTTPTRQLRVFETVIRYLGGLLAAYDISEHKYKVLLDKAVELAEILFGVFDTPNRMPILYYNWQPDSVSLPHSATTGGVAELGTLSMEFTRLAQLTGENKYYDAIDRITDNLIQFQESGTAIPGLFPESIDMSGCNQTALYLKRSEESEAKKTKPAARKADDSSDFVELPRDNGDAAVDRSKQRPHSADDRIEKRAAIPEEYPAIKTADPAPAKKKPVEAADQVPEPHMPVHREAVPPATRVTQDEECIPQGFAPGSVYTQKFHMGGGQDSAYEYFTKEYILLGGLEPKYKKLYVDTVEAVNSWLMYRPMIKDEKWDILFPAKIATAGEPKKDMVPTYEVAHLTCFIGGMYGLGAKIFGRDQDLETAKQLTDGCVWAYQSTATGIMPEGAELMSCPTMEKCEFNQTAWYLELDSSKEYRDSEVEEWEAKYGKSSKVASSKNSKKNSMSKRAAIPDPTELDQPKKSQAATSKEDGATTKSKEESVAPSKTKQQEPITVEKPANSEEEEEVIPERPQSHEEFVEEKLKTQKLPPGYTRIGSKQYILRPEAIESVWYMYRITGDPIWMEKGWKMWEATIAAIKTPLAHSAIDNVLSDEPKKKDEMESFWIAETLKYYYLLFAETNLISLDEWVLNTEAHPFRRIDA